MRDMTSGSQHTCGRSELSVCTVSVVITPQSALSASKVFRIDSGAAAPGLLSPPRADWTLGAVQPLRQTTIGLMHRINMQSGTFVTPLSASSLYMQAGQNQMEQQLESRHLQ